MPRSSPMGRSKDWRKIARFAQGIHRPSGVVFTTLVAGQCARQHATCRRDVNAVR